MGFDIDVSFPGGKKVNASIKGFTVETDQEKESGGEGSAPEPFSLFFVSIATCAGIYAKDFCDRRNIAMDGIKLGLKAEKDQESNLYDPITLELELPESFPAKYHKAIVRSINLCTVKKHIESDITLETVII